MSDSKGILPSMRLDGMTALVTGAGRGIGRGCAMAMAEAGAEVICVSRTRSELDELVGEIEALGGTARAETCDVAEPEQIETLFAGLGKLDILLNNAGMSTVHPVAEIPVENLDRMLTVNCRGMVLVAKEAAKIMQAQGSGVMINLSSTYGKVGRPTNSVYAATKHFVEGFTKSIAVELAPKGVRVCAIGPTAIETPMTYDRLHDPVYGPDMLSRLPIGRFGQVADVVGAVVFLASPAAALITGTTLMVDGGWTAQ
ncbi:MAG: SDR family NAD(P)-dependent oxidoreductase [Minwuia sp.]|uniref:SDR family NAD(P)-dependent oxidoreductase n=1 Tax=Minwuia sp. TaxID=2493630 RepID=UPI003A8B673C